MQLSTVHKIVFKLADINLDQFLSLSANEIDSRDSTGKCPLHWAILHNDLDATRVLLNRGADVNNSDFMDRSPLCYAVWLAKDIEICRLVLAASPDIESRDVFGQTPLMYACQNKAHVGVESCRILLAATDIKPNAYRLDGYTALHIAVQEDNAAQIELLLQYGASIGLENKDGWTPLLVAIKANNHCALSALLRLGVKVIITKPKTSAVSFDALTTAAARGDQQTLENSSCCRFLLYGLRNRRTSDTTVEGDVYDTTRRRTGSASRLIRTVGAKTRGGNWTAHFRG